MTNSQEMACIEVEPAVTPTASLIGLHGLGADGYDLKAIMSSLPLDVAALRLVLPHAPIRPISLNGGMSMRAWYDLYGLGLEAKEDVVGMQASADRVGQLIQRELDRGIVAKRIILAGFSQGGALALYTGLRYRQSLGGLAVLSGYLPLANRLAEEASVANKATAILMAHGEQDTIVSLALAEFSLNYLKKLGYAVQCYRYPMAHSICLQEMRHITAWLQERLAVDHGQRS